MSRARDLFERIKKERESALDSFIEEKMSEELFVDYKRAKDNGKHKKLPDDDRNNYSKAISGFGNSEGGIIIWGVKCVENKDGADIPEKKCPIENHKRFETNLNDLTSGRTDPPHKGVENYSFVSDSDSSKGYVVSYIPKCDDRPLQTIPSQDYYMRINSNFIKIPHHLLSDMFRRRPEKKLELIPFKEKKARLGYHNEIMSIFFYNVIGFKNSGVSIVKNLFFTYIIKKRIGTNCEISFGIRNSEKWKKMSYDSEKGSFATTPEFMLAPFAEIAPIEIEIIIQPKLGEDLDIDIYYGCDDSKVHHRRLFFDSISLMNNLARIYENPNTMESVFYGLHIDKNKCKEILNSINDKLFQTLGEEK